MSFYNAKKFRNLLIKKGLDVSMFSLDELETVCDELCILWQSKKEYKSAYDLDDETEKEKRYIETKALVKRFVKTVKLDIYDVLDIRNRCV